MEAQEITDFKGQKQFLELAYQLYANDPNWVPPLEVELRKLLSPSANSWLAQGALKLWLLKDGEGRALGRIAAFHDGKTSKGGLGFFECIHDIEAAKLLFDTAIAWLKSEGKEELQAPVQPGSRQAYWGLLVDGFSRPAFQDAYNPPYYQALFEGYGFEKDFDQETALMREEWFESERLASIASRSQSKYGYRSVAFEWSERDKLARDLCTIYNQAWQVHSHFTALNKEEVLRLMELMKPVMLPQLIRFAYLGEEPVGFFVSLRDLNQFIHGLGPKQGLWFKLRLALRLAFGRTKRMRAILFGVVPEHQNKGVESILINDYFEAAKMIPGLEELELSWVGDFNPRMLRLLEGIGARAYKRHRTFHLRIKV